MIQFRLNDDSGWVNASVDFKVADVNFARTKMKVDGVIFTENSPDLVKALRDSLFWDRLKHD